MEKLKKIPALFVQKIRNPTKRSIAVSGLLAVLFITLAIYLVACSEDEESQTIPPNESASVTTTATTTSATESMTTSAFTTTERTTEPTESSETATQSVAVTTLTETAGATNPPQTTATTRTQTQAPQPTQVPTPQPTQSPPPPPTNPPTQATTPRPTEPPRTTPPPSHTFTRADMEILQTYGQSLGFGFTAVSNPQSSNPRVVFGVNESATLLVLQIADNDTATLRIGHNYDGYNTHFDWGNTVSSMEAARTVILNFYNSQ